MIRADKILKESHVTEKSTDLQANLNKYTFEVYPRANRTQVKQAVEQVFGVKVAAVNILRTKPLYKADRYRRGKVGKISGKKKAVVTLKEGQAIEMV